MTGTGPGDGKRTPLGAATSPAAELITHSWGQQGLTQFAAVFQPGQGIFSPGYPLAPPEPERVRLWDFPVGVNTVYTPRSYEPVSFEELRALAEGHDITRLAIETRKDQIEKLDWLVRQKDGKRPDADVRERIAAVTEFWRKPDGERPFATWLREALEDLLVLDAPALEVRRNRGGAVIGLDVVDGATIKLLIDETGRRPRPPAPAYEQIIHGRPWRLLTGDDLVYAPRNPRPHKAYGFGPVEQIVMTINIGLRRQMMQLQHFTDGNVPPGLLNAPDGWNARQIREFQEWFDGVLAGNSGARTRLVWGPSGTKYQAFKEAPYKDDFDEWVARVVCYAFSLPPTAFTRQVNRATAETAQEAALDEGLAPLMGWVKRLADHVIQDRLGHSDLEFIWSDVRPAEPTEQAKVLEIYVRNGVYTVNEARDLLGFAPVAGGDLPMIYGTAGATPLGAPAVVKAAPTALLRKHNPHVEDEPRVPAGNPDGGQWTSGGEADSSASRPTSNTPPRSREQFVSSLIPIASSSEPLGGGTYRPGGTIATPFEGVDPLDPHRLNTEPSPEEQQRIADTVNAIQRGDVGDLHAHSYENLPDKTTGAILPLSATGYTAYDVKGAGPGRGLGRILVDKSTGAMYYTKNHYGSFYPVIVAPASKSMQSKDRGW
jgi:hypothetical protein